MGGGEVARYMPHHAGKLVAQAVLVSSFVPFMLKTSDNPEGTEQAVFDDMTQAMKQDRAKFLHRLLQGLRRPQHDLASGQRRAHRVGDQRGDARRPECNAQMCDVLRDHRLPERPVVLQGATPALAP